uniref:Winged helix/forkhead transcription factor FoxQ2c n=1 Tax=Branchiostoma floridae TaxID=7739 RepID=B3UYB0_BRAFL|nr:winged helix/forkhead transcription factor FoxQ2c [Branchiostoma floridae]
MHHFVRPVEMMPYHVKPSSGLQAPSSREGLQTIAVPRPQLPYQGVCVYDCGGRAHPSPPVHLPSDARLPMYASNPFFSTSYLFYPRSYLPVGPGTSFGPIPHEEPKPSHSYIGLIAMAIMSSKEKKLVLSDIYKYILDNYPYFRNRGPGWRNSIRHNLSLNDCFVKMGRSANGKGHFWAVHPANVDDFAQGDFRRRRAQRKVRKHMGLLPEDDGNSSSGSSNENSGTVSPPPRPCPSDPPGGSSHDSVPPLTGREESTVLQTSFSSDMSCQEKAREKTAKISPDGTLVRRKFDMASLLEPDSQ